MMGDGAHLNIKQVMRTALVGVSPADAVMLKGYLRVLLRLEADLEWVAADHPNADLLFINSEFRQAPSVQKLLKSSPDKSVLFVEKSKTGEGSVQGDTLILPLLKLTQLNDWLMTNVGVLTSDDASSTNPQPHQPQSNTQNNSARSPTTAYSDTHSEASSIKAATAQAATKQASSHASVSKANPTTNSNNTKSASTQNIPSNTVSQSVSSKHASGDMKAFSKVIKTIGKKANGTYELIVSGQRVALIDTQLQSIWTFNDNIELNNTWQLQAVSNISSAKTPQDLFQWLWEQGFSNPQALLPFIHKNQSYRLKYWPKPFNDSSRREVLRVFTALEKEAITINQLVDLSEVSMEAAKNTLGALLLSGGLNQEVYDNLSSQDAFNHDASSQKQGQGQNVAGEPLASNTTAPTKETPKSSGSALDDAIARRASGQSVAKTISSTVEIDLTQGTVQANPTPTPQTKKATEEKRGFLSRLRKKLGI